MSALTKKPHMKRKRTGNFSTALSSGDVKSPERAMPKNGLFVTITATGPARKKAQVIDFLEKQGFTETSGSVPWRDMVGENTPGQNLAGARYKENLTQVQLSKLTGIPQRHISEMENDKRTIGKVNAKRFGEALNINYRIFL